MNSFSFLGSLPAWISSGALLTILAIVVRWQLGLRRLRVEADQVQVNARQVDHADEANVRDHYAREVAALRTRIDEQAERHRQSLDRYDKRHEACEKERAELRRELVAVQDRLTGVVRQFVAFQQKVAEAIPPSSRSPEMAVAIANLQPFVEKMSEWGGK
jgi:phage shock protein A